MKTVTIVRADNIVIYDGVAMPQDCSTVDANIHAIQWNEELGKGAIEFVDDDPFDGFKEPNQPIDSIEPWMPLIEDALQKSKDAAAQAEARALREKEIPDATANAEATRTR